MLELAALLTQTRCEENGLEIVGCYFASERLEKPGVSPPVSDTVKSVAKTIVENLKSSGKDEGSRRRCSTCRRLFVFVLARSLLGLEVLQSVLLKTAL